MIAAVHRRTSALLLLLLAIGTVQLCWAHALLMDSRPKVNSAVNGSEVDINLRFNVRIDGARSRIQLVAPDGTSSKLAVRVQSTPDILQTHVAGLKPGAYKLEWQVLASDGHMSRGEIPFTVK